MSKKEKYSLPIGTILNEKWVILEFIAKGGMGEIYRAHQINLKRDVAIKIVSKEWLDDIHEDEEEKENALRRFAQEVLTMAQIRHPNVIQIYDFDKATLRMGEETFEIDYIALEYIPGRTLKDTMREEGFYPEEDETASWLQTYFLPILHGVEAIHQAGIFHRDLKPANVLLDGDIPKIADFGLARSCKLESMTCSMEIKGTPSYMAPEQFMDFKRSDQRADIYALGKILFEAIDGKIPENALPFTQVHLEEAETPFFRKLDEIIRKATDREPENRYQSVSEMSEELQKALELLKGSEEKQEQAPVRRDNAIYMSRWLLVALGTMGLILFSALSFWGYHYFQEHFGSQTQVEVRRLVLPTGFPPEISAPDGSFMKLIPGGSFWVPKGFDKKGPRTVNISAFYMDDTPVTNQQFVDFLNAIKGKLTVEDRAVKRDGRIFLYLGEALQGYEPIIFRDGTFKIKNSGHSACPVIRVTGYGAQAYSDYYKSRLPTKLEWLYVASEGNLQALPDGSRRIILPESFFEPIKVPYPVMLFKPNFFGIRLMNVKLGCWVLDKISPDSSGHASGFAILGGFEESGGSKKVMPLPVRRNPWEAFEEVGFRCVRDAKAYSKGQ